MYFKAFLICILFGVLLAQDYETVDGVLILNDETFEIALQQEQNLLVKFFTSWCGHCKALGPKFAEAAQTLRQENSPIKLAEVNIEKNKKYASKYGINSIPQVKLFLNGDLEIADAFKGQRTTEGLLEYVREKSATLGATGTTEQVEEEAKQEEL